jgi:hypothetical protein
MIVEEVEELQIALEGGAVARVVQGEPGVDLAAGVVENSFKRARGQIAG